MVGAEAFETGFEFAHGAVVSPLAGLRGQENFAASVCEHLAVIPFGLAAAVGRGRVEVPDAGVDGRVGHFYRIELVRTPFFHSGADA